MHIFIDESGTFTGAKAGAISVVGALVVPDVFLEKLNSRYGKVRRGLPVLDGEVKGRTLNEQQVATVVAVARRELALFEATVVDVGLHDPQSVLTYRDGVVKHLTSILPKLNPEARSKTEESIAQLRKTPAQLFLQAAAMFTLLERVLQHALLYYVQRYPKELGSFTWIIDGKDPKIITAWEEWWAWYAQGVVALRSKIRPGPRLEGADYSHHEKFEIYDDKSGMYGTDMSLLLADVRFVSGYEPGVEIVDILTNAVRRGLTGKLGQKGWGEIPSLMIHRQEQYLDFLYLEGAGVAPKNPSYGKVAAAFRQGGRNMVSPGTHRKAALDS